MPTAFILSKVRTRVHYGKVAITRIKLCEQQSKYTPTHNLESPNVQVFGLYEA